MNRFRGRARAELAEKLEDGWRRAETDSRALSSLSWMEHISLAMSEIVVLVSQLACCWAMSWPQSKSSQHVASI